MRTFEDRRGGMPLVEVSCPGQVGAQRRDGAYHSFPVLSLFPLFSVLLESPSSDLESCL